MPAPPDAAEASEEARPVKAGEGAGVGGGADVSAGRPIRDADDAAAHGAEGDADALTTDTTRPCMTDSEKPGAADDAEAAEAEPPAHARGPRAADSAIVSGDAALPSAEGEAAEEAPPDPALFAHALRIAEALVFAADRPVTPARLQAALPPGCDARAVLTALAAACADRPAQLAEVAGGFAFRTAPELAPAITRVVEVPRRLPRAAMETLAIVAYHQPVTRAEIEEIRGASLSQTTLESLLEAALIAPRGRKEVPGRPSLWGTTPRFLEQFGLKALSDLPRREELVNEPTLPLSPPPDAAPPPAA